jgi:hypothetical protein
MAYKETVMSYLKVGLKFAALRKITKNLNPNNQPPG